MAGKWLALLFLFTVLHPIPTATAFGDYNISESMVQTISIDIGSFIPKTYGRAGRDERDKLLAFMGSGLLIRGERQLFHADPADPLIPERYYDFWKLEWEKHGCCFDDNGYPETALANYFQAAVSRAQSYNIWAYLTSAGITVDEEYDVSRITNAIQTGLGVQTNVVQIQCARRRNKLVVTQIFLCVNKRATALRACPTGRQMCSGRPMFPSSESQF
ncbi:unnamed protein product [Dovyalis caffra]|uniref:Uncharacterized protein n=1 Tax=Dovyalis caffra TaxID=77055 RepID=A0AAV1R3A2_9ROSI|nr:unnamed protein product [Dovyalis caffra]